MYYIYEIRKCKSSKSHFPILKLTDKLDLRKDEKTIALSNLSIYYKWKNMKKSHITRINFSCNVE